MAEDVFYLEAGEMFIMPKDNPHAVYGEERFEKTFLPLVDSLCRKAQ